MGLFDGAFDNADGQPAVLAQALQDVWDGGRETARSVGGALTDEQFYRDVGGALRDVAGRGVAQTLGGAVDLAITPFNWAGLDDPEPTLGSEWFGRKMQDAGLISPERRPVAEMLAGFVSPAAVAPNLARRASQAVGHAFTSSLPRLNTVSPSGAVYAMSREGQARLLADLQAGKGSGTYRLGDVTQGQLDGLHGLGMPNAASRDVMMTDGAFGHLLERRLLKDGYTPEEVTRFIKQAMESRSSWVRDPTGAGHKAALSNKGLFDPVTKRKYDAQMPLRVVDDQMELVTVVPRNLPARKTKAPW